MNTRLIRTSRPGATKAHNLTCLYFRLPSPADHITSAAQTAAVVTGLDPSFDAQAFRFLADQYKFKTEDGLSFVELCRSNAEVCTESRIRVAGGWQANLLSYRLPWK